MSLSSSLKKGVFILIPLAVVVLAAAAVGLGILRTPKSAPPPPQRVVMAEVTVQPVTSALRAVALISADESVELKARVSGFLVAKDFTEGQAVASGQVLFQIEPDQYKAAVLAAEADQASAQAQLDLAVIEFNRVDGLYRRRSSPKSDYDKALASREVAEAAAKAAGARLETARLNLTYAYVTAPISGVISDTPFSVGTYVTPESGVLATVVSADPVEVSFGLSDSVMAQVRAGNPRAGLPGGALDNVKPRLLIGPETYYELDGVFSYVAPQVDRNTDTVKFKARFANPKNVLAPGQSAVVSLEPVAPRSLLLVPKEALMHAEGGSFVYKVSPQSTSELVNVEIGVEYDNGFEVLSGLAEGDQVVSLGLMSYGAMLRPGAPVMIVPAADQGAPGAPGPDQAPPADAAASGPDPAADPQAASGDSPGV
ncbi:MAG: efflux RND transporter periplasmic adaptor subunit [Deltaproteobacteria bacterium]|jgi:membrane fusion protein (multidrug efflux system)|nr:efflux RND transporter periplasmic adaptor subunit [Deltaproteobacteria bacterium]